LSACLKEVPLRLVSGNQARAEADAAGRVDGSPRSRAVQKEAHGVPEPILDLVATQLITDDDRPYRSADHHAQEDDRRPFGSRTASRPAAVSRASTLARKRTDGPAPTS